MELTELQNIWQQYDKKLSDNMHLNKEILRRILISKPEKKLNWLKVKAGLSLILPILAILLILVPNIEYRETIDFYIGLFSFGIFSVLTYYWSLRYFLLLVKIDFTNPISSIKLKIYQLEKYKIRLTKLSYNLMPFALIGIFLMADFPFFSMDSLLPVSLMLLVMIISIFYTIKYSIFERFKRLNMQIEEIEQLEKE